MGSNVIYFLGLIGVILVYGQTAAPKVCWNSTWYNNSSPSGANRSDYENQPAKVLDSICTNGKVIAAQCRDEKGEPFTGFKNDTANQYIATCNIVTGLICNPYNNTKALCPDFAIQYGCACSTTPAATVAPASAGSGGSGKSVVSTGSVSKPTSPKSGSGSGAGTGRSVTSNVGVTGAVGKQHGPCGNGVPGYGISQIMLISCMILSMFV